MKNHPIKLESSIKILPNLATFPTPPICLAGLDIVKRMEPMVVDTLDGRIHVQWDTESSATPNGQLTFFAGFLNTSGIYDAWVQDCPLHYTSLNAPTRYDVLATLLLSILAGHNRYAHITALRCDLPSFHSLAVIPAR